MRYILYTVLMCAVALSARAQHTFRSTSLSEALITLDQSSRRYDISFVYDELEDFTVSKTIKKGTSLPDAVREVCGFYPVKLHIMGKEIFVECIQKDRTKLIGKLIDAESQPIAYANITLFHPTDSSYIGGGVSNEAGDFVIPCGARQARVRISCVGFKTIERTMPIAHVGTIRMQMENHYLSGISVSGRASIIRNEADRLKYIVPNDPFAKGQNALELLTRVPMVTVTGNEATILGKGTAGFMLNGRVLELGSETIRQRLWSIRAEDIERIEVISIPSGRYQTGTGGYINIVLNHDQALGWRGDVSGQVASSNDWSERLNASLSYASKTFDLTMDADGERRHERTDNITSYQFPYLTRTSQNHETYANKNINLSTIFRYLPAKNVELGGMASYRYEDAHRNVTDLTEHVFTDNSTGMQKPNGPTQTIGLTAYLDWTLDSLGKKMSLTYNHYEENDDNTFRMTAVNERWASREYQSICNSKSEYNINSLKLDFAFPFPFATFEAGLAYTYIDNEADVNDWRVCLQKERMWASDFSYQEKNFAAYLSAQTAFSERFTAKAGLRLEHTRPRGIEDRDDNANEISGVAIWTKNNKSYDRVLPSLHLDYRLGGKQHLQLNWATGIQRPKFYDLNPFEVYTSVLSVKKGTPSLMPSSTSHLELNYNNGEGLYAVAYYHHGHQMTDWITVFNPSTYIQDYDKYINGHNPDYQPLEYYHLAGFEQETRPINCYDSNKSGAYLRYQRTLAPWLNLIAEGELYYYHAHPELDISPFVTSILYKPNPEYPNIPSQVGMPDLHGWGKQIGLNADLFLNRQHTLMFNAHYEHHFQEFEGLTKYDAYSSFSFALRYSLLNDRLKLSLVADDPFHQHILRTTRRYNDDLFTEHSRIDLHAHQVSLMVSYSLGGKKVRRVQRDTKNTESERAGKR